MSIFASDRDLLDRFRRGEREVLTAVYEQYVDTVGALARRGFTIESQGHVYVSGADVEGEHELIHDTFAKAFSEKARLSFDGLRPYRPFLLRITKNLMIDRFRAQRRQGGGALVDIDEILETQEAPVPEDHEENLHWKQLQDVTKQFLSGLSAECQGIIRLRFEDSLSQDQVAAQLEISRRRVRTVETRVQSELKSHLKKLGLTAM